MVDPVTLARLVDRAEIESFRTGVILRYLSREERRRYLSEAVLRRLRGDVPPHEWRLPEPV